MSFAILHPGLFSDAQQSSYLSRLLPAQFQNTTPVRLLFDLGLRSSADNYPPAAQRHLETRKPYKLDPGVAQILRESKDEDYSGQIAVIILSHVHYDHHGDPSDFPNSQFVVGHGALDVIKHGLGGTASHQHFDPHLFDRNPIPGTEFPDPATDKEGNWKPLGPFKHALDLAGDGSIYVLDMPGHLPGHLNLLCRLGPRKWMCLAGDSFHDIRLLTGEKTIGTWTGTDGREMCIHLDRQAAEESIWRLRKLWELNERADAEGGLNVEIVAAHDEGWYERNCRLFWPRCVYAQEDT
jgi:glyoxylase-like metal-dependent hydrolase (beta-lactamase superfamily II)